MNNQHSMESKLGPNLKLYQCYLYAAYVHLYCDCRFVDCQECGRKLHQICAKHMDQIWPGG